jgi:hypothetical protein
MTLGIYSSLGYDVKALCLQLISGPTISDLPLQNVAYELKMAAQVGDRARKQNKTVHNTVTAQLRAIKPNA